MKALVISLAVVLGTLACSTASAAVVKVGPVAVGFRARPAVVRPVVAPHAVVAPVAAPAVVRPVVRARRIAAWDAWLDSLEQ